MLEKLNKKGRKGFTLVEILTVIAIISVLAAMLFPAFMGARTQARYARWVAGIRASNRADPNCALHFTFERETIAGATVSNLAASFMGTSIMHSPRRLDGIISGATTVTGRFPKKTALSFDGVNDRVEIPHSVSLDFERTNSISIEAWIRTAATGVHAIAGKMMPGSPHTGYDLIIVNGRLRFHLINTWPGNSLAEDSVAIVNDGVWRHIVITYDGSSTAAGLRFYIDGVEVSTTIVRNTLTASIRNTVPFTIGSRQATHPFNGIIDEVAIFDKALTPSEVRARFKGSRP